MKNPRKRKTDWDDIPWSRRVEIEEEMERDRNEKNRNEPPTLKIKVSLTQIKAFLKFIKRWRKSRKKDN